MRRRAPFALAVVAALAIAARAALPWALARTLEAQARSRLGLPVRVANVDLWLAQGAVALEGLVVGRFAGADADPSPEPDRATALLELSRVFVDLEWSDLLERRIHLRAVVLERPKLRIERDAEGRIAALGPPAPAAPPAADGAESPKPWTVAVDRFDLRGLELALADLATQRTPVELDVERLSLTDIAVDRASLGVGGVEIESPTLRIDREFALGGGFGGGAPEAEAAAEQGDGEPEELALRIGRIAIANAGFTLRTESGPLELAIRLDAEQVSASRGASFPIDLELGIGDGKLLLDGRLGLDPLAYRGSLRWSELALPPLGVAARPDLAGWIRSCSAEGDFSVELRSARSGEAGPGLALAGTARLRDLRLADPSDEEISVAWKELELVVGDAFVPLPDDSGEPAAVRVRIERARLVEPDLLFTHPATALGRLLEGGEAPPAEGGEPPLELAIGALGVEGGRIRFRDATVSPPFDGGVADLAIAVQEAGAPEPRARSVRSTGIALGSAPFSLEGGLEPGSGELRFTIERLPLRPLGPYAAGAGYRLASGEASLETRLRRRGARSEARNRLVLHRLDLRAGDDSAFQERFGMPLDVALALLRDPSGDIALEIPVVVDESGARAGLARVLQGALRQALVGALASPLKLVGAVLPTDTGGVEAALEPLAALPGRAALAADGERRIAALARLLADRPALGLRLRGRTGPVDRPLVAEEILAERAAAGLDWPEVDGSSLLARRRIARALEARGRGESAELSPEDAALLGRTAAAIELPAERMQALARRRAEAARDAITSERGIAADRLRIGDAAADGEPAVVVELAAAGGS